MLKAKQCFTQDTFVPKNGMHKEMRQKDRRSDFS